MGERRALAFYLPQYHPTPENDLWWGPGFTDWLNVVRAQPLFREHDQPHLPADLGFYDLRLAEARAAQAELAQRYGVHGFCYYHYWFEGHRLLDRPFNEVLHSGEPEMPFALCWANENWTRVWTGGDRAVLLEQTYSADDDLDHIRWLVEAFSDPRYVRIDGRPVFLIYRPSSLPSAERTVDTWRREAHRLGVGELYLCAVHSNTTVRQDPHLLGFDAAIEFQPHFGNLDGRLGADRLTRAGARLLGFREAYRNHRIYRYSEVVAKRLSRDDPPWLEYPCVTPGFDNSPRRTRGGAVILTGSSPTAYGSWLSEVLQRFTPPSEEENLVFVNAWNEWAEGNHLEPSQRWGHAYLEAHAAALAQIESETSPHGDATVPPMR
jgi:lipopolysaccharide biosynthesis protein